MTNCYATRALDPLSLCNNKNCRLKKHWVFPLYRKVAAKPPIHRNSYYCYCYYWNNILKKKLLNVSFWNNEKMFQIDLKNNLKKEPDLKSRCYFTLLEPVMPGYWICLNPNVSKYASVCVTLWICLNMRETLRA